MNVLKDSSYVETYPDIKVWLLENIEQPVPLSPEEDLHLLQRKERTGQNIVCRSTSSSHLSPKSSHKIEGRVDQLNMQHFGTGFCDSNTGRNHPALQEITES